MPRLPGRMSCSSSPINGGEAFGFAGDPNARTPALDRLSHESLRLTTCVSTCPVCSPCRASIMTGEYPTTSGVFLNDVCLSRDATSLAEVFKQAGYQTGFIGKWHLDGHGRTSFIPPERRQGFDFWRACECTHDYLHSAYFADTDRKLFWQGYDAAAQTTAAQEYIQAHRQRPFLLFLSWGPPHKPCRCVLMRQPPAHGPQCASTAALLRAARRSGLLTRPATDGRVRKPDLQRHPLRRSPALDPPPRCADRWASGS